ncbi:MAG: hypothetical protein QF579_05500, partial [Dehalococcoidia bacterium]|nr:hypothetical protein [Dehalococcoidia bacterium]
MLLRKLLPLPLLAAGLVLVATVPFLGSKARSSQEIVSPKVMVTHLEMEYLTGRSARIDMELNVHNPNDVPMDMNINLELLARNSTGDAQFISLGSLTAVD